MTCRILLSRSILFGLLALFAGASSRVFLYANPAQDSDFTMEGKITEKSAGKLTLSSGDNMIFHVVYSDSTTITKKDGSPGTVQDMKVGMKVSVAGNLAETGEITAKRINLEDDAGK